MIQNEEDDDVWVCQAAKVERLYELAHQRGTFLLVYQISLSSKEPLQQEDVICALEHLRKKCPSLRICFGQLQGVTWFRQNVNQDIDFQVIKGGTSDDVRYALHTYKFTSDKGPLWCARLLLDADDTSYVLDKDYVYSSQLFIGMHHSITDGLTMTRICGGLISILNDVIDGKPIDDGEQIGQFVSDSVTDKLITSKMATLNSDSSILEEIRNSAKDRGIGMPLLARVIPASEGGEDITRNFTHILDEASTKRFIARCKAEGLAVHSALVALADASIVSFLTEKQYSRDSYRLCNGHVLDLRRYWPGENHSRVLGCHAHFPINLWVKVPKEIRKSFWDIAKDIHQDLHHHLKNETILLREAYLESIVKKEVTYDDAFLSPSPMQVDIGFSNLGDVTPFVTEGGTHVKPYSLIRHTSLHHTKIKNFAHFVHTFRGRLILNLLYNTKFIDTETAQQHCRQMFTIMEEVME